MKLRTLAPAKLNLTLEVLGRRPDGYHELRSVVQAITLFDELTAEPATALRVETPGWTLAPEANLVYRAAALLREAGQVGAGARLRLTKTIPEGAGLGGGSSDAAAALRLLVRLWSLDLPPDRLLELAASIGSDVPLFLVGGTAVFEGRGERVRPLPPPTDRLAYVVAAPAWPLPEKTRAVFGELRSSECGDGSRTEQLVRALEAGQPAASASGGSANDLSAAARRLFPGLPALEARLAERVGRPFLLTGAGPALFCPFPDRRAAERAAARAAGLCERVLVAEALDDLPEIAT